MTKPYQLEGIIESIVPPEKINANTSNGNAFYYIVIQTATEETHPVKFYGRFLDELKVGDEVTYRHSEKIDDKRRIAILHQELEIQPSPNQRINISGVRTRPLPENYHDENGVPLF